jgi:hypothetical protein
MSRRFPPPWTIDEANNACFIVRDANGQALAFVYCEDEPGRRTAAGLLTRDEARRIAANMAKLPELLRAGAPSLKDTASAPVYRRGTGYYATMQRALDDNRPMTAEQAATLKRLANAAYELDAFKPNLTRTEADQRIAALTAKLKLLDGPPHTL